jgi:hypothetical protein
MSSHKMYAVLTGCALAVAGLSGCFFSTDPGPEPEPGPAARTGSLTVTWTVAGSRSPVSCSQFGAYDLELIIADRFRRPVTQADAPCTDFTVTVELPEGIYEAEAVFVDSRSNEVSIRLPLPDVRITPHSNLTIEVEFPSSSRL